MAQQAAYWVRLNAGQDINGNARRVFVILNQTSEVIDAIDEGCSGKAIVGITYPNLPEGPTFPTTVKEYRRLLKEHDGPKHYVKDSDSHTNPRQEHLAESYEIWVEGRWVRCESAKEHQRLLGLLCL